MKAVLNIVAAVLIAAGLVVAVASLLTPGQVILGIDFKLAATLVVGGLILHALANALTLLERMSSDLRQLRKAGSEEPPWLRQVARQSAAAVAAAGVAPVVAAAERDDPAPDGAEDPFSLPATMAADDAWPPDAEDHLPEADAAEAEAEAAAPSFEAETAQLDPWLERDSEPEPGIDHDLEPAGETPAEESDLGLEPDSPEVGIDDKAEDPAEPAPTGAEAEAASAPEPAAPEPAEAEPDEAEPDDEIADKPAEAEPEMAIAPEPAEAEPEPEIAAPPIEDIPDRHASFTSKLRPSEDRDRGREDIPEIVEETPPAQEETAEEHPTLYVVEQRMFRGKQARVLSDGTIEAETAEGWMRFEDFDHLEEYLDAMADLGR